MYHKSILLMTPERYKRAGKVYDAALQLKPESRGAFVETECCGDEELRREVESLLAAHEKVGDYFASPALEVAAGLLAKQQNPSLMGRSFSHYRVFSLIGVGGMGEVYLAEDAQLGRHVALKMPPNEFTQDRERVRRFEQEARAASALNHPNIVTIYEVGQVNGRHFIATEYIDGETLRVRLSAGKIELEDAVEVGLQMASALHAAHEAGIVHRDIKPENVMLRRDGLVKVLDFGLAKLAENTQRSEGSATQIDTESTPGLVMGTLSYMSPEQAKGERLDARTDIFSLGVVIYEMLAGHSPFVAASSAETLVSILDREPTPLSRCAPNVPERIERIVEKALRKNKEERYKTAGDLAKDLKDLKREIDFETILGHRAARVSENKNVRATDGSEIKVATVENDAVHTDYAVRRKTSKGAGYLINELKRRSVLVAIATAVNAGWRANGSVTQGPSRIRWVALAICDRTE